MFACPAYNTCNRCMWGVPRIDVLYQHDILAAHDGPIVTTGALWHLVRARKASRTKPIFEYTWYTSVVLYEEGCTLRTWDGKGLC